MKKKERGLFIRSAAILHESGERAIVYAFP
jgi:hypothetical protein